MTQKERQMIDFPYVELSILNGQYDQARMRAKKWSKVDMIDFIEYLFMVYDGDPDRDNRNDADEVLRKIKTLVIKWRKQ